MTIVWKTWKCKGIWKKLSLQICFRTSSILILLEPYSVLDGAVAQLKNRPTLVHAEELPSGEWLRFIGRILRLSPAYLPRDALNSIELSYFIWGN